MVALSPHAVCKPGDHKRRPYSGAILSDWLTQATRGITDKAKLDRWPSGSVAPALRRAMSRRFVSRNPTIGGRSLYGAQRCYYCVIMASPHQRLSVVCRMGLWLLCRRFHCNTEGFTIPIGRKYANSGQSAYGNGAGG